MLRAWKAMSPLQYQGISMQLAGNFCVPGAPGVA
jgi:hypothetical protein